jgi:myosin heavy chain 9/10/11/14
LKGRLEAEFLAKSEEAAARRKLATDLQDFQIKYEAEAVKASELQESLNLYRGKADNVLVKLETAELAKIRAEKAENFMRLQLKDLEDSLAEAVNDRKLAEEKVRFLEEHVMEIEGKMEDDAMELADLSLIRRKLQEELEDERERYRKDLEETEATLDATRKKYQKELQQLAVEIELEKSNMINIREANKDLHAEVEELTNKLEEELRSNSTWKRDKERLEAKVADTTKAYNDMMASQDEMQTQIVGLLTQVRDLRNALDEAETAKMALEKSKRSLEQRLDDIGEQYNSATQSKQSIERLRAALNQEANELRELLEEQQEIAALATEKSRKSEIAVLEAQTELQKEREINGELMRMKVSKEC